MRWKPQKVIEYFNLKDFSRLCGLVDELENKEMVKFDILNVQSEVNGGLVVTVVVDGGKIRTFKF